MKIENFLSGSMTGSSEGGSYISVSGGKYPFIYLGEGVYRIRYDWYPNQTIDGSREVV